MRIAMAFFGVLVLLSYITFGYLEWYPGRYQYVGMEETIASSELVNLEEVSKKNYVPLKMSALIVFDRWTGKVYSFVEDANLLIETDVVGKKLHGQILTSEQVEGLPETFEKIKQLYMPK